jgi:multidrug efflux system membrane fusion protein
MAQEDSRDTRPQNETLGHSFRAHSGDTGAAFEDHNFTPNSPKKKSHAWIWILGLIALVVVIFLISHNTKKTSGKGAAGASGATGASGGSGRGQTGPAAITVGQSKSGNINIYDDALGTVTPTSTVTVYSQITGVVLAVHYREGQIVHRGEPLVDIDPRPYEATLQQAEGTLEHDTGVLDEAKMDLTRYQAALAKNAIARQQVEDQEKAVVQDEGTVKTDEGTAAYDKVQLSYCHIVSPINGRVGLRLIDPGNTVFSGSSSTLVVITQLQPITVVFNISEDDLPQVQGQLKGKKALEVDAFDRSNEKQIEAGKLMSLDNQIDTTTGTVKFRASFANQGLLLFPNQFVNARLLVNTLSNTVLVPNAAVQHNGTAAFVYIVNANETVSEQAVTALTSNDTVTAVTGVGPNVNLATSGFDRLEPGVHVQTHQGRGAQGASGSTGSAGKQGPGSTTP